VSSIRLCLIVLTLATVSSVDAQSKSKYPICAGGSFLIVGEVPDNPFTANIVVDSWQTASDGSRKHLDLPSRDRSYYVARDSKGRVIFKSRGEVTIHGTDGDRKTVGLELTICDPVEGKVTRVDYLGHAFVRPQNDPRTTENFTFFRNKVSGREDLGPEVFDGVPANRYRLTKTQEDGSLHELVISEELEAQLSLKRWEIYPTVEQEISLSHINRRDPPQEMFKVPEGVLFEPR
jgi:hypothetical protein